MLNSITLTASMRTNLASLKTIATQMNKTQNILSTGKKVNSAIDNASAYYQARALTNRASDLSALLDSMGQGIQTIQAATEGLTSATAFLEQATAVANQAASKATNIVARVSTEEELLAAVNSGQEGFIVLENDITMSDNQNIVLNDNQSLVGAKYFDKNATQTTLNFNYDMSEDVRLSSPIKVGNNAIISDLNINFVSNTRNIDGEGAVILIHDKKGVKIQNLNINTDTSAATKVAGFHGVKVDYGGVAELGGYINIKVAGSYTRGVHVTNLSKLDINNAKVNVNAVDEMGIRCYSGSVINVNGKSEVNVLSGDGLLCYYQGTLNINDDSSVNMLCSSVAIASVAEINVNNQGRLNISAPNCDDNAGSSININSVDANVNIDANIGSGSCNFSAVDGAQIATKDGTYTFNNDVNDMVLNSTNLAANGTLDADKKAGFDAETAAIFADFEAYMATNVGAEVDRVDAASIGENKQFSDILEEFDKLISDTSYQGVNLLKGADLTVTFNESRSNKFTVSGRDMSAENLGLITRDWTSKSDVETSIKELTSAVDKIRDFQSELGNNYSIIQTRQNFTEALCDVLETGADNLVLADMNEASAEYLMLQTRQQLATNSLSLAAQSAQSVLSLF